MTPLKWSDSEWGLVLACFILFQYPTQILVWACGLESLRYGMRKQPLLIKAVQIEHNWETTTSSTQKCVAQLFLEIEQQNDIQFK